jgi:signal transduction histidine kinase
MHPLAEMDMQSGNIRYLLLASFIAGLIVILVVSLVISAKITGPLLRLKDAAKEIAAGRYSNRIETSASDEVGELAAAFNSMSKESEHRIALISDEKRKLDSILESMGEGVIAMDGSNEILAINHKAQSILDTHIREELFTISKKVSGLDSRHVAEISRVESSLLVCGTPLRLAGNETGVVLILNDITELRLLQEKQRLFVTNVSHELKTPLTTIIGYIDLLEEKGGDRDVFEASVHYLKDAGDRLLRLVTDLIDLSSLSRFEFEIEPRSTGISAVIRDITGQMALKAQKFDIQINTDIDEAGEIMVDPVRIKQAVVNVLDNAIKYSAGGNITIALKNTRDHILLDVTDTGCGIPPQMLDKIFEPFYRVDKARSRNLGGNGLGLSITKEIIEKHGGSIEIHSTEGKGTKVTILMPRTNAPDKNTPA